MPKDNAVDASRQTPEEAIRRAFSVASEGRRQASMAASCMASAIFRRPQDQAALRLACLKWLAGTDLAESGTSSQSSAQAVIKRLNECIDGGSRRVTSAILTHDQIAQLRVFRQKVRDLIKGN